MVFFIKSVLSTASLTSASVEHRVKLCWSTDNVSLYRHVTELSILRIKSIFTVFRTKCLSLETFPKRWMSGSCQKYFHLIIAVIPVFKLSWNKFNKGKKQVATQSLRTILIAVHCFLLLSVGSTTPSFVLGSIRSPSPEGGHCPVKWRCLFWRVFVPPDFPCFVWTGNCVSLNARRPMKIALLTGAGLATEPVARWTELQSGRNNPPSNDLRRQLATIKIITSCRMGKEQTFKDNSTDTNKRTETDKPRNKRPVRTSKWRPFQKHRVYDNRKCNLGVSSEDSATDRRRWFIE